jgi:hypothetical protein
MAKKRKLKEFHFDFGDSNDGPIGGCAVVVAYTKAEALKKLRDALPDEIELKRHLGLPDDIAYFNVYLNPAKITAKHIDFADDVQEEP